MRTVVALIVVCLPCFGQAGKAELFGAILDPTGLPIANAKVQAIEQATEAAFAPASDERGVCRLLGLPPGQYVLTVEQPGFRTYRQSGITLRIADQTAMNVSLALGLPTETVNVTVTAPLLQTASGSVSFSLDRVKVETLPLDGRNFIPLVALSPGVALPG